MDSIRWAQTYHPDIQSRCMIVVWMLDPIWARFENLGFRSACSEVKVGTAIFPHIIKMKDDGIDLRWAQNWGGYDWKHFSNACTILRCATSWARSKSHTIKYIYFSMNRVRFELWVEVSISIRVMVSIEYFIILKQFQCCSRSKPILNVIRKSISFGSSDYCSSRTLLNTPKPDQN